MIIFMENEEMKMNVRLYKLEEDALIDLESICVVSKVYGLKNENEEIVAYGYKIFYGNLVETPMQFEKEDKAELSRFRLIERWNAYLDYRYGSFEEKKEKKK